MREFRQGVEINKTDEDFQAGLKAIVDYRGDVTIDLQDGQSVEGFIFSADQKLIHYYPKSGGARATVQSSAVLRIRVTGEDTSAGKSWDDWVKRRDSERAKAHKRSQT